MRSLKRTAAFIIIIILAFIFFTLGVLYFIRDPRRPNPLHGVSAAAPYAEEPLAPGSADA